MQNDCINLGVNADVFVNGMAIITQNFDHCAVQMQHDLHVVEHGFDGVRDGMERLNQTAQHSNNYLQNIFDRQRESVEIMERQNSLFSQIRSGAWLRVGSAIADTIGNVFRTGIQATQVFEDMSSKMYALTGSMDSAKNKFWELNALEDQTTISTDKLSQAFITLGNNALSNSSKQLKAYSAIALGTGKDINELVNAVVQFSQGRVEKSLARFGITAKENANSISVTFRGVTTEIAKTSDALEKYLSDIAENNFDGVLEAKYNTVEASMKRLDNAWGTFCTKIMQSDGGFGELIIMGNDFLSNTLNDISEWFNQPDVVEWFHEVADVGRSCLESVRTAWNTLSDTVGTLTDYMKSVWSNFCESFESLGMASLKDLELGFLDFFKLVAQGLNTVMTGIQTAMKMLKNTGEAIGKALSPDQKEALINAQWKERVRLGLEDANNAQRYAAFKKEQNELIHWAKGADLATKNAKELETAINKLDESAKKLFSGNNDRALAEVLKSGKKPPEKPETKPIGKENGSGSGGGRSRGGGRSATDKALLDAQRGFEQLQRQLEQTRQAGLSAYQKEQEQYAQNIAKLQEALALKAISQEQYYQTVEALEQEHQNKMAEIQRQADLFIADLLGDPVLKLQDEYSRKLELLEQYHADQLLSEETYLQAMKALYDKFYEEMGKKKDKEKDDKGGFLGISTKGWQATNKLVSNTANMFDSLTQSMNESSGAYKALFAVQKSFAVASAIVNCMAAISDAMSKSKLGWYEWATIFAEGMAMLGNIVSVISSVSMHDKGGNIPAGQYGIVGEIGPELVRGPASVTSRKDTADLLSRNGDVTVNLIEDRSRAGQVSDRETDEGRIIDICVANIRRGGDLADAVSHTYGLARQGI